MKADQKTVKDIELICSLDKDWRPDNIEIKKAGGQTNNNWIVQFKNKKFFARLPWERADIVDREVEAGNALALAKCRKLVDVLPKYYLYIFKGKNILSRSSKEIFDLPDGAMVVEYIEGKDIDGVDLENPKIQTALVRALYYFHTSSVKFVNNYDVFRDEVLKYRREAKKYNLDKLISKGKIKKIEEIEELMKEKLVLGGRVSTHNDLIFENLRLGKDGKVYLLDFEYGGLNIRDGLHYDLGIILGGNLFQENPIKIKTYDEILKKASKIYQKKFNPNKAYCGALVNILVMFWWGLVKYFSSTTREDKKCFKDYALKRADGIEFLYNNIKENIV